VSGTNYTVDGQLLTGIDNVTFSPWVRATWKDYTELRCESPAHPVPARVGVQIGHTKCMIRVSNDDGGSYHNDSFVMFQYQDKIPTVTHIGTQQRRYGLSSYSNPASLCARTQD
jgi:hypothetical protein|tara:strand:+ start:964 stop:1305 length:342 start_codon:yes stop_codon:yes gene_type:complete